MRLSYQEKIRIFRRDPFRCQYCGLDGTKDFDTWHYANLNVDHIDPRAGNDDSNLVTACCTCNLIKGAHPCKTFENVKE